MNMDKILTALAVSSIRVIMFFVFAGLVACGIYAYKRVFAKKIAKRKQINNIGTEGYLAFQNLQEIDSNPYATGTEDHDYWQRGYVLARRRKENVSA